MNCCVHALIVAKLLFQSQTRAAAKGASPSLQEANAEVSGEPKLPPLFSESHD